MLITELRDAYREANKSFEMSIQLEGMKDEVKIFKINLKARKMQIFISSAVEHK